MSEHNKNFEDVKRLLKLKRHEIPPPGYFNNFSSDVLDRIRAGETGSPQSWTERLQGQSSWLSGLLGVFETRPGVIGGFATSLCLVLLIGVVMADRPDSAPTEASAMPISESGQASVPTAPVLPELAGALTPADSNSGITISTNPVASLQPVATLFGQQQNPLFQSASFMPASR